MYVQCFIIIYSTNNSFTGKTLIANVYIGVTVVVLCMYAVLYARYSKGIR